VVDGWAERALGGCTLYVSHPGGRSYDRFPVNALEAESRRASLFVAHGHGAGRLDSSRVIDARNPDYPLTLDLRRLAVPHPGAGKVW
jgi:uncharacterized protein (DUF2126 family)